MQPFARAAAVTPDYWPFAALGISVTLIAVLRVHAFVALILVPVVNSVSGLAVCLAFSKILPLVRTTEAAL